MAFVKGQSGNPSGRPISKPLTDIIKKIGLDGGYERVVKVLYERAYDGDIRACQEIISRVEGKLTDKIVVEAGSMDLISLLTRKSADNAKNTQSADDTEVPGDAGNADDNQADA